MTKQQLINRILLILVIGISIGAAYYFMNSGDSMLYRDAKSHLNIARRVFFSQTPGLAQLGGVWLPFPHVLMLPTIWHDHFYYSGLSGIIPSMIAFVSFVYFTWSLIVHVTKSKIGAMLGCLVLITNPALLYLQSTPMTEVIVLATITGSIYFLTLWITKFRFTYLIGSAVLVFMATLTRYDGWFVFVCEIAVVLLSSLLVKHTRKKSDGITFIFASLGGFGIVLWLLYSKLIFGNFLNFALGKGTGAWDAARVSSSATVSSKGDIIHSALTFSWMSMDNAGIIICTLGIFGYLWFAMRNIKKFTLFLTLSLLLAPFIFNIISLYLGLSIAYSKHVAPFQSYNLRYGTAILPFVAFFIGYLASKKLLGRILAIVLIVVQSYLFYTKPLEILADANVGNIQSETTVAHWIRDHDRVGSTLISTLSHDPLLFESRLSMSNVVYEGNQHLWENALTYPEALVHRVVMKKSDTVNDEVRKRLYDSKVLKDHFKKVYDDGDYQVYDLKSATP